ncbi:MAG: metal ABC transporter ATP-binding protein [Actinobacteria bacterium]|nr:metal ABC transporter ATP-binding protein [Actinomycetota bacterium]
MKSIISVSGIGFRYDTFDVLKDVSFDLETGDYIGVVGYNGSGKTTLIKVILGLLKPYTGSILIMGIPPEKFNLWDKIGYMPQNTSLLNPVFPARVEEVVSLGLLSKKRFPKIITDKDKRAIDEVLHRLNINELKNQLIGNLSGGQQQKVFLARALVTKPELLILDEPSNALDPATREQFFSILEELNKNYGTAIIFITHDIGQIGKYANKMLYIEHTVIFYGSFENFCKSDEMSRQFGVNTQHIICHQHD